MKSININGKLISLASPKVMGIVNVTPDSFYAGSRVAHIDLILEKVAQMLSQGADILDIGGYSSRPGATDISVEEEIKRVVEPIRQIKQNFPDAIISIDTFRRVVAEKAISAGAVIINDTSAGQLDYQMHDLVTESKLPYIAMHMRGTPQKMVAMTSYDNIVKEMMIYFSELKQKLTQKGVHDIIIDPGFGFAKTIEQNFEILKNLRFFSQLDLPLLVGVSRKSMIYKTLNIPVDDALNGSTVLHTYALMHGAAILRVHDVQQAIEVVKLLEKIDKS